MAHFFRQAVGVPVIPKETLSQRTGGYQSWVEAFTRNHRTPIRWSPLGPEPGVREEGYVLPWLRRMVKKDARVLHFQEHGGRSDLPNHCAEISHQGP